MAEVTRKGFRDKNGNKVSLIAKVINAITGHFAGLNNKGEVVDSGYGPSDFAEANHNHNRIKGTVEWGEAEVYVDEDSNGYPMVSLKLKEISDPSDPGIVEASISFDNIDNLKCALLGLRIAFVRDENDDYVIDSELKEHLNNILEKVPENKCVPCLVYARWWNDSVSAYDSGYFPGTLCRHNYTSPGIPRTIYLSFLGNLFYATRTANNDFPNVWTKFENPFATV